MDNGCKFSPDKSVKVSLSFSAEGAIVLGFKDRGPGIPKEEMQLVFNAFYRSPKTSYVKGSGIGLSLVESILRLHHVEMKVDSEPGRGTCFQLFFPINQPQPVVAS